MEFTEIIGAGEFLKSEENLESFIQYLTENGKILKGYYGNYLRGHLGREEYSLHLMGYENGEIESVGFSSHVSGDCIWHVRFAEDEILLDRTDDEDMLSRSVSCMSTDEEEESHVPVTLVHADVLPCFLPGEPVAMQVVAFPYEIRYYPDEETCDADTMIEARDMKICFENGRLLSFIGLGCTVKGVVKSVEKLKTSAISGDPGEDREFYYVMIDTQFGPLPLCHSADIVKEAERDYIREGACLFTTACVVSGDVAIEEYKDGAVYDELNDLKLLRESLEMMDFSRMEHAFAEDAVYISDEIGKRADSGEAVWEKLQSISDKVREIEDVSIQTWLVRVADYTGENEENKKYIGRYAVVYSRKGKDGDGCTFFADVNEEGKIRTLHASRDKKFRVSVINAVPAES